MPAAPRPKASPPGGSRDAREIPHEGLLDYSLRLSQQVVSLEAQNLELQDAKSAALASRQVLADEATALRNENDLLRQSSLATFYEGKRVVQQAGDEVKEKQGEVMLLRHQSRRQFERAEALQAQNVRLGGIADQLQGERRQLQRDMLGWEATASSMQTEMAQQAAAQADLSRSQSHLQRQLQHLALEKHRADAQAAESYVTNAQLQLVREELGTERQRAGQLRDELLASLQDAYVARSEAKGLAVHADSLQSEVYQWRHAEGVASASQPAMQEELQYQSAAAVKLRERVEGLEREATQLRRELTRLGAENGGLRTELQSAKSEAQRWAGESAKLVAHRQKAELETGGQERSLYAAQQHISNLSSDAAQLRRQMDTMRHENGRLWSEMRRVEAENIILRSQVKGAAMGR